MAHDEDNLRCACGARGSFSAPVCALIVHLDGRERPVPLLPDRDHRYRLCSACDAMHRFVGKAVSMAPVTSGERWTEALLVFDDDTLVGLRADEGFRVPLASA